MTFSAEITIVTEGGRHHYEFRALFFDVATSQFYGGTGATALEALAWCMDEYIGRVVYGLDVSPARDSSATPGSRFRGLTPSPSRVPAQAPPAITPAITPTTAAAPKKRRSRKAA